MAQNADWKTIFPPWFQVFVVVAFVIAFGARAEVIQSDQDRRIVQLEAAVRATDTAVAVAKNETTTRLVRLEVILDGVGAQLLRIEASLNHRSELSPSSGDPSKG